MNLFKSFFSLLFLAALTISCSDENHEVAPAEPEFVSIDIPEAYKNDTNLRTDSEGVDDVIIDVKITTVDGIESIGKVRLVMPDDGSILYLGMTETLLTETGLTPEYWIKEIQKNSDGARLKAGCFAKCREMEKGKGRGACKAECWLDVAVKVATVVAVVAAL